MSGGINITEPPPQNGWYVAYIDGALPRFALRRLLTWDGSRWFFPGTDQRFRGTVYGWVGPLPLMELVHDD